MEPPQGREEKPPSELSGCHFGFMRTRPSTGPTVDGSACAVKVVGHKRRPPVYAGGLGPRGWGVVELTVFQLESAPHYGMGVRGSPLCLVG